MSLKVHCNCCPRCCTGPCAGSQVGNCVRDCHCGKIVVFDREEWRAAWETNRVALIGTDGKHVFIDDKLVTVFQPTSGECGTHHGDGQCDCVGVVFMEKQFIKGGIVLLSRRLPDKSAEPGAYVLLDDPGKPGATLDFCYAGEDLETGDLIRTEEVIQIHRDFLDYFTPVDLPRPDFPLYTENLPSTVAEAVEIVLTKWPDEMVSAIRDVPPDDLIEFHMSIGATFRNEFELWFANGTLLMDCGTPIPDEASMVILKAVWEALQER